MKKKWISVPENVENEWNKIFNNPNEGLFMDTPCPNCGEKELHCYYMAKRAIDEYSSGIHFIAEGFKWEWCSRCGCYLHSSNLVPDWWKSLIEADLGDLTAEPEVLESLIQKIKKGDIKVKRIDEV